MSDAPQKIAELIRQGRKIEAIKLLRETTGVSLKQAKEEIDRIEESFGITPPRASIQENSINLSPEVLALIEQGNKAEATKLLSNEAGLDLKQAKTVVNAVSFGKKTGCMSVVMLLVVFVTLVLSISP